MAGDGALARLFERGSAAGLTDNELLDRFLTRRGPAAEAAFEALVARHGPMVARVCRAILRAEPDVEDAFQATFLVLVRRAGSIGERNRLGPWLHGVAHRVARKARAGAARRRGREGESAGIDPPARPDPAALLGVELAPVLHEEVDRLPAKYREPVVLCHLQGLTHAEAARELAWPVGTVSVRLVRARKLLADRLARRGVTASAPLVATALAAEASAAVALAPARVAAATAAAVAATGGLTLIVAPATVTAGAASLARRTSMTLLLSPLKWLTAPTVALATAAGATLVGSTDPAPKPDAPPRGGATPAPTPAAPAPGDPAAPPPPGGLDSNPFLDSLDVDSGDAIEGMFIGGRVGGLGRLVEQLRGSDPQARFRIELAGEKIRFQDTPSRVTQARRITIGGRAGGLGQLVEQLRGSDPQARFRIELAGGEVRLEPPARTAKNPAASPSPPGPGDGKPDPAEAATKGAPGGLSREPTTGDSSAANELPKFEAVPPAVMRNDRPELGPLPPGYFDLAAVDPGVPGNPRPVKVGQVLQVEVLEALPGRPIRGRHLVRDDGTIGIEFYGNLYVVGLNRDQIKVKLIEKLRHFLSDQVLGLTAFDHEKLVAVPPLDSNRVFVDDQPAPDPGSAASKADQPAERPAGAAAIQRLTRQVADLSGKLDRALLAIEQLGRDRAGSPPK